MLRIASYSQKALLEIENDFEINYEQRKQGSLQLFWDTKDIDKIAKDISILEKFNIQSKILGPGVEDGYLKWASVILQAPQLFTL